MSREAIIQEAHQAVVDTAQAFHLQAATVDGVTVDTPCSYQIVEPGFRPFKYGKASPEELQEQLDLTISTAGERKIDLGIESRESLRKLTLQLGLGVDCSNFAFRALSAVHDRLEIEPYTQTVYRSSSEILALHRTKDSWQARDASGEPRRLSDNELEILESDEGISIDWMVSVFGKDPEFITGSKHIAAPESTTQVTPDSLLPGSVIAFKRSSDGEVSHVAVVESVNDTQSGIHVDFWHSWHTRDFNSGLRRDVVTFSDAPDPAWSHEGLSDPRRYAGHLLLQPKAIADIS